MVVWADAEAALPSSKSRSGSGECRRIAIKPAGVFRLRTAARPNEEER